MERLQREFLEYLRFNRNASPHTARAYASDLRQFVDFARQRLGREPAPADVDHRLIRTFLADLYAQGRARASSARTLAAIRSFCRYLRREGVLADNPAALVAAPRPERRMPAHLDIADMDVLLAAPDAATPLGRRDRAILELLYASGLRLSELVGLDLDDVNLGGRLVRVRGKGGRERIVPFHERAADVIRDYLPVRHRLCETAGSEAGGRPAGGPPPPPFRHPPGRPAPAWASPPAPRRPAARRDAPATPCSSTIGAAVSRGAAWIGWCGATWPCRAPGSASVRTRCGTRSPRTCWSGERTCGRSRSCWATRGSARPSATPTSARPRSPACTARPTPGRSAGGGQCRRRAR